MWHTCKTAKARFWCWLKCHTVFPLCSGAWRASSSPPSPPPLPPCFLSRLAPAKALSSGGRNPSPYTLSPSSYTLKPSPYTLNPSPYTLHRCHFLPGVCQTRRPRRKHILKGFEDLCLKALTVSCVPYSLDRRCPCAPPNHPLPPRLQSHIETLVIHKLSSRKFTTHDDLCE